MKFRMFIDAEGANPEDPPCDVRSGNRPRTTVVGGEHSHYHGIHAPQADSKHHFLSLWYRLLRSIIFVVEDKFFSFFNLVKTMFKRWALSCFVLFCLFSLIRHSFHSFQLFCFILFCLFSLIRHSFHSLVRRLCVVHFCV